MGTHPHDPQFVRFGVFELDLQAGELRKNGRKVPLQEQPFQVLAMLVERPGEVVSREDLHRRLWADDTFVDFDQGLNRAINKIRESLGDTASSPAFVETLPKRGYRFLAPVQGIRPAVVPAFGLPRDSPDGGLVGPNPTLPQSVVDGAPIPIRGPSSLVIGLAVALLAAVAAAVALWVREPEPRPQREVVRFHLTPGVNICWPVISPNGRHIAYDACEQQRKLWIWDLGLGVAREIEGTEGASHPFWSPGSDFIGFFADGALKKVSVTGGPVATLCTVPREYGGGTWAPDGKTIVYGELIEGGLYEVASSGGQPKPLIDPEDPLARLLLVRPHFLPLEDGRRMLLYSTFTPRGQLMLQDLDSGERRILGDGNLPAYSPSGHILYWSHIDYAGELWALPFSIEELQASGKPFLVAEDVWLGNVAANGTLVYLEPETRPWQLVWLDRRGNRQGLIGRPQQEIVDPVLSPDGRTVLVSAREKNERDIWLHDRSRPVKNRLTADPPYDMAPVWSPSGNRVAFRSTGRGMFVKATDLSAEATALPEEGFPLSWSASEQYLLYACGKAETGGDLCYLEAEDDGYQRFPFIETPFEERAGALSPDGRFVAYASNETGRFEVFVQRFPDGGDKQQVSDNGGGQPVWSKDSSELFYVEGETLVAVPVTTAPDFSAGRPVKLFPAACFRGRFVGADALRAQYDVSADGQFIVLADTLGTQTSILSLSADYFVVGRTIRVVQNWFEEFREDR